MALGRRQLVSMLTVLLCLGFMVTALVNYVAARNLIREAIIGSELPLTSDNIYSEIQKDLVRPIFVSSMMAGDTFLRDWMLADEKDLSKISRYLTEIKQRYGAHTAFLVSDRTGNYYQADGLLKQVRKDEFRDVWYYRVRAMATPYEINVDPDMANRDALTIFVNYRVLRFQGQLPRRYRRRAGSGFGTRPDRRISKPLPPHDLFRRQAGADDGVSRAITGPATISVKWMASRPWRLTS